MILNIFISICFISPLLLCLAISSNKILIEILPDFLEKFNAPKPLPIRYDGLIENKIKLMKTASVQHNLSLKFVTNQLYKEKFLIVIKGIYTRLAKVTHNYLSITSLPYQLLFCPCYIKDVSRGRQSTPR